MGKGLGKTQIRIIEALGTQTEEGNFHHEMYFLVNELGVKQPNIHRALKRLINDGLVKVWSEVVDGCYTIPKRINRYMLTSLEEANKKGIEEWENDKADKLAVDTKAADKLGIDVQTYRIRKMFS